LQFCQKPYYIVTAESLTHPSSFSLEFPPKVQTPYVYLLRSALARFENLGAHVLGHFKIFERNLFYFYFWHQNWVANTCTLCTTGFAGGPAVRTVRIRGRHKVFANFKYVKDGGGAVARRRRRSGATAAWRVTSIRHTASRLRFAGGSVAVAALHACKKSPPCKTVPTETLSNAKRDRSPVRAMTQATTTIYIFHGSCF
jgi:hypothetical protein